MDRAVGAAVLAALVLVLAQLPDHLQGPHDVAAHSRPVAGQIGEGLGVVLQALAQELIFAVAVGEDDFRKGLPGKTVGAVVLVGAEAGFDTRDALETPFGVGDLTDELELDGVLGE